MSGGGASGAAWRGLLRPAAGAPRARAALVGKKVQIVTDANGQRRISSIAVKPSSGVNGGMSIDLESFILVGGFDPRLFVTTPIWVGSVYFGVGVLRGEGLQVGYHPVPHNKFHGEVWGATKRPQWKRPQELAVWYVQIPGVQII